MTTLEELKAKLLAIINEYKAVSKEKTAFFDAAQSRILSSKEEKIADIEKKFLCQDLKYVIELDARPKKIKVYGSITDTETKKVLQQNFAVNSSGLSHQSYISTKGMMNVYYQIDNEAPIPVVLFMYLNCGAPAPASVLVSFKYNSDKLRTDCAELVAQKKYTKMVELVIKKMNFEAFCKGDKNCLAYSIEIKSMGFNNSSFTVATVGGEPGKPQTLSVNQDAFNYFMENEAQFNQFLSSLGHEFQHIVQRTLQTKNYFDDSKQARYSQIEREFMAYYWQIKDEWLPLSKEAIKSIIHQMKRYSNEFDAAQKEKYKDKMKEIVDIYNSL